ncbi:hypothetical protein QJS66_03435 [Kocuria rhizophila]|nr:hypothetical protein QJS66_03435 [Kocuria rhizophila]
MMRDRLGALDRRTSRARPPPGARHGHGRSRTCRRAPRSPAAPAGVGRVGPPPQLQVAARHPAGGQRPAPPPERVAAQRARPGGGRRRSAGRSPPPSRFHRAGPGLHGAGEPLERIPADARAYVQVVEHR